MSPEVFSRLALFRMVMRWFLSASTNKIGRGRGGVPPLAWLKPPPSLRCVPATPPILTAGRPDLVQLLFIGKSAVQGLLLIRYTENNYVALAILHIQIFQVLVLLRDDLCLLVDLNF